MSGRGAGTKPPVILAFGGYDPTGGAGVLMDVKAVHGAGGYAVAVPSCLAIQSTAGFDRLVPLPRTAIDRSLACAATGFPIAAVKIGMVATRAAAEAILAWLAGSPRLPVVLDPVLRTSAGVPLLQKAALPAYRRLLAKATVLTPNLREAEKILDREIGAFRDAVVAARDIALATGAAVLLKGGHFPWPGRRGVDILFDEGRAELIPPGRAPHRRDPHGTGCALASAVAARLALGDPLPRAARTAKTLLETMVASGFSSAEGRWTLCFRPPRGAGRGLPARPEKPSSIAEVFR